MASLSKKVGRKVAEVLENGKRTAVFSSFINNFKAFFFSFTSIVLLPLAVQNALDVKRLVTSRSSFKPDYEYPHYRDLMITFYSLLFFIPGRILLSKYVFGAIGDKVLPLEKWNSKDRKTRYYLIQLGYHVQSLIFHVVGSWRNDYLEMILHHTTAVWLVLFSYFGNFLRIGSLVLIVHDYADILGYFVKVMVDTKYTMVTLSGYFGLLAVWAYTRFYVFPFYVITGIFESMPHADPAFYVEHHWMYFVWLLRILLVLHIYWYFLFIMMGFSYIITGVPEDTQDKTSDDIEDKAAARRAIKKKN